MNYPMNKILFSTLFFWTWCASLQAVNVVAVEGAQGAPGQNTTINVSLSTDTPEIVAAEIRVPLPEEILPVEGSLVLNETRMPGYSVTADINGTDFVIVLFNTSLKPIPAGSGDALSFDLYLGDNPGNFDLTPTVKLSNGEGSALPVVSSGGILSVLAPRMELKSFDVNFGRVPIFSEEIRRIEVSNTGTLPLALSGYSTDVEGLTAIVPESIGKGESSIIELHYKPTVRNEGIDGKFTPTSNGVGQSKFIRIQSIPFSVNELHLSDAIGICDDEVTIEVAMNNMEPIVGIDFTIQLPEELEFVENSVEIFPRASSLLSESGIDNNGNLRIVLFGSGNQSVEGHEGSLLQFKVKLKGKDGVYSICPSKCVLANASGENMFSAVYGGSIGIKAPNLFSASNWDIGNIPIHANETFSYVMKNEGEVPLTVESVIFHDDIAECVNEFPIIIDPNMEKHISIRFKHPELGSFQTTMNVYTNDPNNRMKQVDVRGYFYSQNEILFNGRYDEGLFFLDASLINENEITALQLDVICPYGITTDENLLTLSERAENHSANFTKIDDNRYRLIIFSLNNDIFIGNEGNLFSIEFKGESPAGKQILIENIKLSSILGEDITSPDSDVKIGVLPASVNSFFNDSNVNIDVFDLNGILIRRASSINELKELPPSIYIISNGNSKMKISIH